MGVQSVILDECATEGKTVELNEILLDLSKKLLSEGPEFQLATDGILNKLDAIYDGGYRHVYSSFFPIIDSIGKGDERDTSFQWLSCGLKALKVRVHERYLEKTEEERRANLYRSIGKLYDHISL
jgi:hypothetical protein